MLLIFFVLFIIAVDIVGCARMKRPAVRIFLGAAAGIWVLIAVLCGWFIYETEFRIKEVTTSESPDGMYEMHFQEAGDLAGTISAQPQDEDRGEDSLEDAAVEQTDIWH